MRKYLMAVMYMEEMVVAIQNGDLSKWARQFMADKGLSGDTVLTPELKKELAEYTTDRIAERVNIRLNKH